MEVHALPHDLAHVLRGIRSVGVITGAGISAESGIPTYRGVGGLYEDPEEGERTVEALSGPTIHRDPDRTWRAVAALAQASVNARPNPAHAAIARIEEVVDTFVLLTQNVDGLHRLAGSRNVIDIHGDVLATRCMRCDARGRLDREQVAGIVRTPHCGCGGRLRPDAVLFGEMLPTEKVERMQRAFYEDSPELLLVVGTSALFAYIAEPVVVAARRGRLTVEVNPTPTGLSGTVRYSLRARAGDVVPQIADALAE